MEVSAGAAYPGSMAQELGRGPSKSRDDEADAFEKMWAEDARRARQRARTGRFGRAVGKILLGAIEIILDLFP
jgi:hypothetical protein